MNEEQLQELLKEITKEIADQGRIVDARLIEKERQIREVLKKEYNVGA